MYYSSKDKNDVIANSDRFGNPSVYIEIVTSRESMVDEVADNEAVYGVTNPTMTGITEIIRDLAKPILKSGDDINVGIGKIKNGKTHVIVRGSANSETIGKLAENNIDGITALVAAMINQLIGCALEAQYSDEQ
jgi:hypothetical protein